MPHKVQITKTGLEELKKELEELTKVKRPKIVDRLSNARGQWRTIVQRRSARLAA